MYSNWGMLRGRDLKGEACVAVLLYVSVYDEVVCLLHTCFNDLSAILQMHILLIQLLHT